MRISQPSSSEHTFMLVKSLNYILIFFLVTDESLVHLANDISEKLVANSRRCPERIACWINQKTQRPEDLKTLKEIMR